ncbi:hypothetical protein [Streptomyces sp. UNOB3_S3]|uniref:hypothetical protein n=1 Tax=Streptomyces sp. UNOB3_S3 TaxID=2871682 RepID=UPI001E48B6D4|nr:hypothetical protein [Streptomyces sp. UNOB3_S3]MCC3777438.1 hypothetical protein [Streptomyces sp. UNOB3_S3]
MSEQHHRNPYDRYDQHGQYPHYEQPQQGYGSSYDHGTDGQTGQAGQPGQSDGSSYGYGHDHGYDGQQAQHRQPAAWPQPQQNHQAYDEPHTQTWQTQTWDVHSWQQPLDESREQAPAPAAYDTSWPTGGGEGAASWDRQPSGYEPAAPPAHVGPGAGAGTGSLPVPRPEGAVVTAPVAGEVAERPMTAAEKAKAEGRPQIVSPGLQPALITAVLAGLLAAAAPLARPALAVPVVLLQAVTAAGWFRLNGMWPARQGIALAFLGGVAADIGLLATDTAKAPTVLLGTLGVWILLVVVLQLRSHASPDERLYGLTAATASTALAVMAGGHLAADPDAVVIGGLGVAAAVLARALPLPSVAAPVVALIAATGAGIAGGQLTGFGPTAALLGLAAGVCALVGLRVASYDYPSRFVHMTAGVALPLALAAPAVYVLGRALG